MHIFDILAERFHMMMDRIRSNWKNSHRIYHFMKKNKTIPPPYIKRAAYFTEAKSLESIHIKKQEIYNRENYK